MNPVLMRRLRAMASSAQVPDQRETSPNGSAPPPPPIVEDDGNTFIPYHPTRGTLIDATWHI